MYTTKEACFDATLSSRKWSPKRKCAAPHRTFFWFSFFKQQLRGHALTQFQDCTNGTAAESNEGKWRGKADLELSILDLNVDAKLRSDPHACWLIAEQASEKARNMPGVFDCFTENRGGKEWLSSFRATGRRNTVRTNMEKAAETAGRSCIK